MRVLVVILCLFVIGCRREPADVIASIPTNQPTQTATVVPSATATTVPTPTLTPLPFVQQTTLGHSTGGHPLEMWQLGNGERQLVVVSGIHGGAEWNTIELAYAFIDYFVAQPEQLPANVTLTLIPVANPDGQMAVMGKIGRFSPTDITNDTTIGRLNANLVDLNRNWDCQWQAQATWGIRQVSGGTTPFSEVETVLLRDYLTTLMPDLVIFYHSAADGVYTGQCDQVQHEHTLRLAASYADAAGYALNTDFSAYTVTGDASDYLNRVGIAAFTVELRTREDVEWAHNLAGLQMMIGRIAE